MREASGRPRGVLVLLHGRGADEDDLFPLADMLDPERELVGLVPRGVIAIPGMGNHWYISRELGYPDPRTFLAAAKVLDEWFDAACEKYGVGRESFVMGGFSMGAVMSYATGLGEPFQAPAGIMSFSGFIPTVEGFDFALAGRKRVPIAIGHGTLDPLIGVEWSRQSKQVLSDAGFDITYKESPMGHEIDHGFVYELRDWVKAAVSASIQKS